ncbi:MAG: NERD domain-containing protein [Acholeplasmataceae bacterium]|nr:NERD domain-containing protein [Acholeplasmataceae bacterium]
METFFFIVVPAIIGVAVFFLSPYGRGVTGKLTVRVLIGSSKPKKSKYVIRNIIFTEGDMHVKIDYVVINTNGVHVIEVLNMPGVIFGRENDIEWTQTVDHGLTKQKFYSPVKRNSGQILALKEKINTNAIFHSYIIFTNRASIAIKTQHVTVEYPMGFKQALDEKSIEHPMLPGQIEAVYQKILEVKKNCSISYKEYKKQLKSEKQEEYKTKSKKK